jgi:hypothetical protein
MSMLFNFLSTAPWIKRQWSASTWWKMLPERVDYYWACWQCCGTVPFCLGSGTGSGSQIFDPRFRLRLRFRFRFLPSNFKLFFYKNSCRLPWFLFLLSPTSCMCRPVSHPRIFSLIFFLQQEPEPEPRARIRFRFRFFLGQNDTVPAVPVPQHCLLTS